MSLKKKQNKKPPQNIGSLCNLKNESLKEERSQDHEGSPAARMLPSSVRSFRAFSTSFSSIFRNTCRNRRFNQPRSTRSCSLITPRVSFLSNRGRTLHCRAFPREASGTLVRRASLAFFRATIPRLSSRLQSDKHSP